MKCRTSPGRSFRAAFRLGLSVRRWHVASAGALLSLAFSAIALANDSTARLDTGELVLIPNADVRLSDEDLFISPDEIRVRYLFESTSNEPITTTVAFPIPPVDLSQDVGYSINPVDPVDFIGFKLWIDDRPTAYRIDARATVDGRDVTDILNEYNIPLTPFTADLESLDRLRQRLNNLPADVIERLRAEKIIHGPDWGEGFNEAWTANISYFWTMTFPPGQTVEVRHSYTPVPTSTFYTDYDVEGRTFHDSACIDTGFERAVKKLLPKQEYNALDATILAYILTTANNWRDSIGHFHLTIDKLSTEALVSLCRDGIRKTGPTTFEWEARDYRPERDLTVLFVKPLPKE